MIKAKVTDKNAKERLVNSDDEHIYFEVVRDSLNWTVEAAPSPARPRGLSRTSSSLSLSGSLVEPPMTSNPSWGTGYGDNPSNSSSSRRAVVEPTPADTSRHQEETRLLRELTILENERSQLEARLVAARNDVERHEERSRQK